MKENASAFFVLCNNETEILVISNTKITQLFRGTLLICFKANKLHKVVIIKGL